MWIIVDWANNHLYKERTFDTFDDGIEFISEHCLGLDYDDGIYVVLASEYKPNKLCIP